MLLFRLKQIYHILKGYSLRALDYFGLIKSPLKKLSQERLDICVSCDTLNKVTFVCMKSKGGCGCKMKEKTLVREAVCPQGKW